VKTEQHYKEQIAKEIRRIAELEHNKEAADKFWKTLEKIKPKSCIVKSGWGSGEGIDFLAAFEKGGESNPFELFVENIPEKAESFGFIMGLAPKNFHYNPKYSIEDETHFFVNFKLLRHGGRI